MWVWGVIQRAGDNKWSSKEAGGAEGRGAERAYAGRSRRCGVTGASKAGMGARLELESRALPQEALVRDTALGSTETRLTTLTAAARTRILATKGGPALQLVGAALHLVKGEGAPQHTAFFAPPLLPNLSFKGASSHNKLS